jgi:hypothetical protein
LILLIPDNQYFSLLLEEYRVPKHFSHRSDPNIRPTLIASPSGGHVPIVFLRRDKEHLPVFNLVTHEVALHRPLPYRVLLLADAVDHDPAVLDPAHLADLAPAVLAGLALLGDLF